MKCFVLFALFVCAYSAPQFQTSIYHPQVKPFEKPDYVGQTVAPQDDDDAVTSATEAQVANTDLPFNSNPNPGAVAIPVSQTGHFGTSSFGSSRPGFPQGSSSSFGTLQGTGSSFGSSSFSSGSDTDDTFDSNQSDSSNESPVNPIYQRPSYST